MLKHIMVFCLSAAVLFPSAVKFAHTFSHHEHEVCDGESAVHFHELDIDCEFFKFKINNTYKSEIAVFEIYNPEISKSVATTRKSFLLHKIQSNRFLRGPPISVSLTS